MNDLATSFDVRATCQALERKMDEVVNDLKRDMRELKRSLVRDFTIIMASMNTVMFLALDATLNA
jgi:hypothetical protein